MRPDPRLKIWDVLATAAVFGAALGLLSLLVWRIRFGVDFTDEAFYAAIPFRFARGGRPFIDEMNLTQTAGLITYPFVKLFLVLSPAAEGLILFLRWIFLAFYGLLGAAAFWIARKFLPWRTALLGALVAAAFLPHTIPALSYNNLGMGFFAISGFLAVGAILDGTKPRLWALAGFAQALAVLAYPTRLPVAAVSLAIILVLAPKPRGRALGLFALGAAPVALALGILLISAGGSNLTEVMSYMSWRSISFGSAPAKMGEMLGWTWYHLRDKAVLLPLMAGLFSGIPEETSPVRRPPRPPAPGRPAPRAVPGPVRRTRLRAVFQPARAVLFPARPRTARHARALLRDLGPGLPDEPRRRRIQRHGIPERGRRILPERIPRGRLRRGGHPGRRAGRGGADAPRRPPLPGGARAHYGRGLGRQPAPGFLPGGRPAGPERGRFVRTLQRSRHGRGEGPVPRRSAVRLEGARQARRPHPLLRPLPRRISDDGCAARDRQRLAVLAGHRAGHRPRLEPSIFRAERNPARSGLPNEARLLSARRDQRARLSPRRRPERLCRVVLRARPEPPGIRRLPAESVLTPDDAMTKRPERSIIIL